MPSVIANVLIHTLRIALVAVVAAILWATVSLPLGLILTPYVAESAWAVGVMLTLTAVATFAGAGYISARYITPGSILHAAAAGFLLMFAWSLVSSKGPWYFGLYFCFATAGLAAGGAWIARRHVAA